MFTINFGVTAAIQNLTIRNGSGTPFFQSFTLGGGIVNYGTLAISNITLSGNSAYFGGGIINAGPLTISNSTLSGNSAGSSGGGIFIEGASTVTISNSTLSGNSAGSSGGGIYNGASLTISNSTLSGNSATYGVGGVFSGNFGFGTTTVKNSIVGNNSGGDCNGTLTALGANLDTDGSCGSTNFTQVTSALLNLGPLALNAPGSTKTLALLPGSVAIDSAPDCTDVSGSPVTTDQRGVARPDGGESACDIGAFEHVDQTPFASFTAKLSLEPSDGTFDLKSRFTLGATTKGIDPLVQPVSLAIGSYSVTFAPGSFKKNKKGAYVFDGTIHGVELNVRISPLGGNSYWFQASGEGAKLKGIKNPVTVTLTIGADLGSVVVHAKFDD